MFFIIDSERSVVKSGPISKVFFFFHCAWLWLYKQVGNRTSAERDAKLWGPYIIYIIEYLRTQRWPTLGSIYTDGTSARRVKIKIFIALSYYSEKMVLKLKPAQYANVHIETIDFRLILYKIALTNHYHHTIHLLNTTCNKYFILLHSSGMSTLITKLWEKNIQKV